MKNLDNKTVATLDNKTVATLDNKTVAKSFLKEVYKGSGLNGLDLRRVQTKALFQAGYESVEQLGDQLVALIQAGVSSKKIITDLKAAL